MAGLCSLTLAAACGGSEQRGAEEGDEYATIMRAVLLAQPDIAVRREDWLASSPEQRSWFADRLDHRLCVERETAGLPGDFDLGDRGSAAGSAPADAAVHSPDLHRQRWENSPARRSIPETLIPSHLRWDGLFSICPSGVVRFGNPVVKGDSALVFFENTSPTHGMGGEVMLRRSAGEWRVIEQRTFWQA